MRKNEIKEGVFYRNKGKGTTIRRVIAIGDEHKPKHWYSDSEPPDEPGVLYSDIRGRQKSLYISSFAMWAGSEVNLIEW